MKKHLLLCMMLLSAFCAMAKPLSPQEALTRASRDNGKHSLKASGYISPVPLMTVNSSDGAAALYVFASGNAGYIIVSADDCAVPVLGYSDSGSFNSTNLPPQMMGWLEFYARQVQYGAKRGATYVPLSDASASGREAISPMIQTKWDQGSPYNDDCPLDNGKRSVTGCVATAMAQAMYFHQWPAKGQGSHSYKWNGEELSLDFANTTFDWNAMTLTYDKDSSTAAKEAVATLMYNCGVSVDMNYSSDESGASSMIMVSSLYKYFDYDKSMTFPQRSFYGSQEWEDMVYSQLSQGLPVLYCGQSYEGGHQFICDGYDGNGYFHFNWGWSGMSDGYYLLDALNPLEQGIGGSASDSGFNYDQGIVLNMKPAKADSQVNPLIYCYGSFAVKDSSVALGSRADFDTDYFNFGCSDVEGYLGIKLVDSEGNIQYIKQGSKHGFASFSGYGDFMVTLPEDLQEGTYTVTPVFQLDGSSDWVDVPCPLSGVQALTMTVENGTASFTDDTTAHIEVSNFTLNTPVYLGENFSASFTMTNTGTSEYYGEYLAYLFEESGEEVCPSSDIYTVDLLPGQSVDVTYISAFPTEVSTDYGTEEVPAGTYVLGLFTHFTKQQLYIYQTPVNVSEAPAETSVALQSFTVNDGKPVTDPSDVKFSGVVACEEGYFAGRVKVAVFKEGATETDLSVSSTDLFIPQGESASFEVHANVSSLNSEECFAVVYVNDKQISREYSFSLETSGISCQAFEEGLSVALTPEGLLVSAPVALGSVKVYALDGRLVGASNGNGSCQISMPLSGLASGEYLVVATDADGHSVTRQVLR